MPTKLSLPLLLLLGALAAPGCGEEEDDRPLTAEYITTTILAPTCGRAGCHSDATAFEGYAFDDIDNAREAFQRVVIPGDAEASLLVSVIAGFGKQMPPEAPLPRQNIALIRAWINAGAEGIER